MVAWANEPVRVIVLEKVKDGKGDFDRGAVFQYTYKSHTKEEAMVRAMKRLQGEHPGENPLNWKVIG